MMVLQYGIIVFVTQLIFIGTRTWNVKAIAKGDIKASLISGGLVHISWLVSIALGTVSMNEIITNFNWSYLPVVMCSLSGGLLGTYVSMMKKKNRK